MIDAGPKITGHFIDDDEQHLILTVGQDEIDPYLQFRADRGERCVEMTVSRKIYQERLTTLWEDTREFIEEHLEAKLPHPDVVACWWTVDDDVAQPFLPYEGDEFTDQIGGCYG